MPDLVVTDPTVTDPPANGLPAAPPAPEYFIKPDGTLAENFWEHPRFPAELKDNMNVRAFKRFDDFGKSYAGLEQMRGYEKIPIPGENSPPEVADEAFRKLGWPESPEKYTPLSLEGIPEDQRMPEEVITALAAGFHKEARLTDKQYQAVAKVWDATMQGYVRQQRDAEALAATEAMKPLREKWSGSFDANKGKAEAFLRSHLAPEAFDKLSGALLGEPGGLEFLHKLATQLGEGQPDVGVGGVPVDVLAAAQNRLAELRAAPDRVLYDQEHPMHAIRMAEFRRLEALVEKAKKPATG